MSEVNHRAVRDCTISLAGFTTMATYKDPVECFATLEVIERLLEIRTEFGFSQAIYLPSSAELADSLDANGFSIYAFVREDKEMNFGDYRAPLAPHGDSDEETTRTH
ncbi:MAG TPA: hypothetical protein VMM38_02225 [Aridibacter sp.]|nr:hypothetical protein [Aridibacter sp.]